MGKSVVSAKKELFIPDRHGYIILPENNDHPNLSVQEFRTHYGKTKSQSQKALGEERAFMLPLKIYTDFLSH